MEARRTGFAAAGCPEDGFQTGLGQVDLGVRVARQIRLHCPCKGFDLLVHDGDRRDQGADGDGIGAGDGGRLAQLGVRSAARMTVALLGMSRRRARSRAADICAGVSLAAYAIKQPSGKQSAPSSNSAHATWRTQHPSGNQLSRSPARVRSFTGLQVRRTTVLPADGHQLTSLREWRSKRAPVPAWRAARLGILLADLLTMDTDNAGCSWPRSRPRPRRAGR